LDPLKTIKKQRMKKNKRFFLLTLHIPSHSQIIIEIIDGLNFFLHAGEVYETVIFCKIENEKQQLNNF